MIFTEMAINNTDDNSQISLKAANRTNFKQSGWAVLLLTLISISVFALCIASVVLSDTYLNGLSQNIQRCAIGAFYLSVLGALFITQVIYSLWQALLLTIFFRPAAEDQTESSQNTLFTILADAHLLSYLKE
jgi:hypothetical protein